MKQVPPPADGYYYHSIDLPGYGEVAGAWDLREGTLDYTGRIPLAGRRVLELGAANGFLSFFLESQGAAVVPFDLAPGQLGDIMAVPGLDREAFSQGYARVTQGLERAWWHAREAMGSKLERRHGTVYSLPEDIGPVDVSLFGLILLHLRDPYTALEQAARLTRGQIVVTELYDPPFRGEATLSDRLVRAIRPLPASVARESGLVFNPTHNLDPCTWWTFSPGGIQCLLQGVGFTKIRVHYHDSKFRYRFEPWGARHPAQCPVEPERARLFTVVAERG